MHDECIAAADDDASIHFIDFKEDKKLYSLKLNSQILSLAWHPKQKILAYTTFFNSDQMNEPSIKFVSLQKQY